VANKNYPPLSAREEEIATIIVDCAFKVHKALGPGLLENVYEVCYCHELGKHPVKVLRQVTVPITYDGIIFEDALRLDVLVDDLVICELKAVETLLPVHEAQLLSQLKLTGKRLGFLINFNVPLMKQGIKRFIL
jgi:GxxExxY protein